MFPECSTVSQSGRAVKEYFSRYGLSDLTLLQFVKCMLSDVHHATQIALLEQVRTLLKCLSKRGHALFDVGEGKIPYASGRVYVTTYWCLPEPRLGVLSISVRVSGDFEVSSALTADIEPFQASVVAEPRQ